MTINLLNIRARGGKEKDHRWRWQQPERNYFSTKKTFAEKKKTPKRRKMQETTEGGGLSEAAAAQDFQQGCYREHCLDSNPASTHDSVCALVS